MTDAEIIKALEVCAYFEACADCPFGDIEGVDKCMHSMMQDALDLINRLEEENANYSRNNRSLTEAVTEMQAALKKQSAEIERLQNECFCIANERDAIADCLDTAVEEAIKEFAERVKMANTSKLTWFNEEFDNLVKEMAGDAE